MIPNYVNPYPLGWINYDNLDDEHSDVGNLGGSIPNYINPNYGNPDISNPVDENSDSNPYTRWQYSIWKQFKWHRIKLWHIWWCIPVVGNVYHNNLDDVNLNIVLHMTTIWL